MTNLKGGFIFNLSCVQTDATLLANNSQHCCMLDVASVCTPCCMLLDVVAQSLKPVKLLTPCKWTLHCWELLPPFARSLTRIAVAFFCWNFVFFLGLITMVNSNRQMRQLYTYVVNESTQRLGIYRLKR